MSGQRQDLCSKSFTLGPVTEGGVQAVLRIIITTGRPLHIIAGGDRRKRSLLRSKPAITVHPAWLQHTSKMGLIRDLAHGSGAGRALCAVMSTDSRCSRVIAWTSSFCLLLFYRFLRTHSTLARLFLVT